MYLAKAERCASRGLSKFIVPDSRTGQPGKNLRLFGFGVSCVCTNIVLPGTRHDKERMRMKYQSVSVVFSKFESHKDTRGIHTRDNAMGMLWPSGGDCCII